MRERNRDREKEKWEVGGTEWRKEGKKEGCCEWVREEEITEREWEVMEGKKGRMEERGERGDRSGVDRW